MLDLILAAPSVLDTDNLNSVVSAAAAPGLDKVNTAVDWVRTIVTALAVVGFLAVGAVMALTAAGVGHQQNHMGKFGTVAAGCLIIGLASQLTRFFV